VCLFYQPPKEVDAAADEQWRPQDYFFGNTYKTLAKQVPYSNLYYISNNVKHSRMLYIGCCGSILKRLV
jgi:hypothetical protein